MLLEMFEPEKKLSHFILILSRSIHNWFELGIIYFAKKQGSPAINKICCSLRRPLHFLKTGSLNIESSFLNGGIAHTIYLLLIGVSAIGLSMRPAT